MRHWSRKSCKILLEKSLIRFLQDSPMPTQSTTKPLEFEGIREADEK